MSVRKNLATLLALTPLFGANHALAHDPTEPPAVCTINLEDSKAELDAFKKAMRGTSDDGSRLVELTPTNEARKDSPDFDWLSYACRRASDPGIATHVQCGTLVISGHYNGGFLGKSGLSISSEDLERHACAQDCKGLLGGVKQIYVLDGESNKLTPIDANAKSNYSRAQIALGKSPSEADHLADLKYPSFESGGKSLLEKLAGPGSRIHGLSLPDPTSQSKKTLVKQIHQALLDDQSEFLGSAIQNVDKLNAAPPACVDCQSEPAFPDSKTCAELIQSPKTDKSAASSASNDPCSGVSPSELGVDSCPKYYELHGDPGSPGSCCVLKPLGDENLRALEDPKLSDPEILGHLNAALKYQEVRNYVSPDQVPAQIVDPELGSVIRVTEWNIDEGKNFDAINRAIGDCSGHMIADVKAKPNRWERTYSDSCKIGQSDLLILDEVDDGMCRSQYRDVARELARNNGYNYAFSPEFVEIDPKILDPKQDYHDTCDKNAPRPPGTMSLHGDAILSRYPITQMHTLRFDSKKEPYKTLCYDWMNEPKEANFSHIPQRGINLALDKAFKVTDDTPSQQRRGSRICQIATIQSPKGPIRVVNCHLESKTNAQCRDAQMKELVETLKGYEKTEGDMPVLIAGDWNTTQSDGTPATIAQELKDQLHPKSLIENAIKYTTPFGLTSEMAITALNAYRSRKLDPTQPCLFPIQDRQTCENGIFKTLEKNGFEDPALSNERSALGYRWTYSPDRDFGRLAPLIGDHMRLDFMMEKGLAIENPETLQTTRFSSDLSDHVPITGEIRTGSETGPDAPDPAKTKKPGIFKKILKKLRDF